MKILGFELFSAVHIRKCHLKSKGLFVQRLRDFEGFFYLKNPCHTNFGLIFAIYHRHPKAKTLKKRREEYDNADQSVQEDLRGIRSQVHLRLWNSQ